MTAVPGEEMGVLLGVTFTKDTTADVVRKAKPSVVFFDGQELPKLP